MALAGGWVDGWGWGCRLYSVGSIWGTFGVPVPGLVAGGWGDGWCRCHGWWLVAGVRAGAGAMAGGWWLGSWLVRCVADG